MAFKMVALFATLACASAGYLEADHHSAHYSPASAVSYSSITRAHPAKVAKTVTYAEPAVHYAAPLTKTVPYVEPAVHYAAPVTKTLAYAQPAVHYAQPSVQYIQEPTYTKTVVAEPTYAKTYVHQQPTVYAAKTLAYQAPIVKSIIPAAKTFVSEPVYAKTYASAPIYAKTYASEPVYAKTYASEPIYAKTYASEPIYTKTIVQQPTYVKPAQPLYAHSAPVVASKTLRYAPEAQLSHVSYQDASAHYDW